jgi:hypothetical protein
MKLRILIGLLAVVCVLAAWWFTRPSPVFGQEAERIVAECGDRADEMLCYEKEIPALFPAFPLADVFEVIRAVRRLDSSYQFCHVVAHKVGELAVAQDPMKWLDLIPLNPSDGLCSNGFIHGLIVGRFRSDSLDAEKLEKTIPDFARACEPRHDWSPSGLDQAICYHGMGHLFMFITQADMRKSLEVCARVSDSPTGNFMRVCREGVFMQIYQPLEPDDFALIDLLPEKPSRENYRRMCAFYSDGNAEDEGACLREAWPLFREEIMSGSGAVQFCAGQPNEDETTKCYETATTIIGRQSLGNVEGAASACEVMAADQRAMCFATVAQAFLEEDRAEAAKALVFCDRAPQEIAGECIATLVSRARWIFSEESEDLKRFCAAVPSEYRARCKR